MSKYFDDLDDDDVRETFGCMFPDECVMPGMHYPSECATAEMMQQMYEDNEVEG